MEPLKSRKVGFLLAAIVAVLALSAGIYLYTSATQSEPGDFKGMQWGADLHGFSGMKLLAEDGDVRYYQKENDSMKVDGAGMNKIVYGFYKGRFFNAMAYFGAESAYTTIKESFAREYGDPLQTDQNARKCFWNGETTSVLLTWEGPTKTGRIAFFFKPIQMEVEASRPTQPQ